MQVGLAIGSCECSWMCELSIESGEAVWSSDTTSCLRTICIRRVNTKVGEEQGKMGYAVQLQAIQGCS